MQNKYLISFESPKLTKVTNQFSIYDKEMLGIMHALVKFKQYLVGGQFAIKTNHNSLRYLLNQKDLNEW